MISVCCDSTPERDELLQKRGPSPGSSFDSPQVRSRSVDHAYGITPILFVDAVPLCFCVHCCMSGIDKASGLWDRKDDQPSRTQTPPPLPEHLGGKAPTNLPPIRSSSMGGHQGQIYTPTRTGLLSLSLCSAPWHRPQCGLKMERPLPRPWTNQHPARQTSNGASHHHRPSDPRRGRGRRIRGTRRSGREPSGRKLSGRPRSAPCQCSAVSMGPSRCASTLRSPWSGRARSGRAIVVSGGLTRQSVGRAFVRHGRAGR